MTALHARALIGRAVVSIAGGEKIGLIANLQIDLPQRTVLGLLIGGDDLFRREQPSFLPIGAVRAFGRDAVTIADTDAVSTATGAPHETTATLDALKKRVVTAGGAVIGDGDDIVFDDQSGAITDLQLAPQGGFLGIGATTHVVPVDEIIEFGRDVITVRDTAVAPTPAE